MTNVKNDIGIFGINCGTWSLREYDDYYVGDKIGSALCFIDVQIEPSQSMTKSIKKIDINLYEGIGKIISIDKYAGFPTWVFDCGIYAFSTNYLPKEVKSGSFVKMRFYLIFDDDSHWQLKINGERLWKVIPGMVYDWKLKDILIWARDGEKGEKYFEDLPVAYVSPKGEIYKRIKETNTRYDCGGYDTNYILLCEKL